MVKDFRLRQELRHFLQQCHCDAGGLTRQTLLNRTHWASPSNASSLGLRTAMELRALLLLLLCFPALQAQTPHAEEGLSEGSSLSIQCPYTAQADYHQQKVWCHVRGGQCEPLVETTYPTRYPRTNRVTNGKVTIEDNPMYKTVSITMTNLQVEDSGTYLCAYRSYHYDYLPLKIISLNVFKELHKWELDNLSVQCKYSGLVHSTDRKAWCRSGQTGCEIWLMTDNLSTWTKSKDLEDKTLIQDDAQKRTVTITMKKLQAQDAGVYWCVLYRGSSPTQKMEIRLSVSKILAGTTLSGTASTSQATPSSNTPAPSSNVNTFILLSGVLSILFILALTSLITLCVKRRKQLKRRGNRQAEDIYDKPEGIAQLDSTERMESPKDDSKDVKYITLNFKSQLSPEDPLYCNVEPSQAHGKPKDENVEYATIALKQLPTNDKG
ncbi:CMRF35-like molecule 1 isoform X6 [Accipiter gentilis]|uniref:CMRF35-like molecule 1 isoform X6 n=1 Tax=Astur gentilis TaxID=8957 RepID=UPI0021107584|nr:CMRF35-like molecule 1 isoform X6 [Accipiter gentilis]